MLSMLKNCVHCQAPVDNFSCTLTFTILLNNWPDLLILLCFETIDLTSIPVQSSTSNNKK